MGVDLIVVNYRSPHDLNHFILSLQRNQPTIPWDLVVVNVDPLQDDVLIAQHSIEALPGRVVVYQFDSNVGYATAVNMASTFGSNEVLAIFNADTRLTPNVIDECHNVLMSREEWAVLGPRQIDNSGKITHGGIFGSMSKRVERGFHHRNDDGIYGDVRDDATTVSGACFFVKRAVWDELTSCPIYRSRFPDVEGAFLPTMHYWDETWCAVHAITHGYRCVYYGPMTMIHLWHNASRVGGWAERQITKSRSLFAEMCDLHDIPHE